MFTRIKSKNNQYLKLARRLADSRKQRQKSGLFVFEGIRLVEEAFASKLPIEFVFMSEDFTDTEKGKQLMDNVVSYGTAGYILDNDVFRSLAQTENPQGIMTVAEQPQWGSGDTLFENPEAFILVVDEVQDPGNLGTIIRSAHGAGVDGVYLTLGTVDIYNNKAVRASMGSIFHTPFFTGWSTKDLLEKLIRGKFKVLVADVAAQTLYYEEDFAGSLAVVVGNENKGPSEDFKRNGHTVRIPCNAESLNVSAAAAVLLYERVRLGL